MSSEILRKRWRKYWDESERILKAQKEEFNNGGDWTAVTLPPFPEELRDLSCGARTRKGTPCKLTSLFRSGRCKFHGGMSTGPKTKEGKRYSAMNGRRPKRRLKTINQAKPM